MGAKTAADDGAAAVSVRDVYERIVRDGKRPAEASAASFLLTALVGVPVWLGALLPLTVAYQLASAILPKKKNAIGAPSTAAGGGEDGTAVKTKDTAAPFPKPDELKPLKERAYDVVLLGATGFTGGLAAEHLARTYGAGKDVRWAVAGRSESKLRAVLDGLARRFDDGSLASEVDAIVVDTSDRSTLPALVSEARCVISTAGPFSKYGSSVVEYCARYGTNYADITGEVDWVKRMIMEWDDVARRTGARIVPLCGHDSVPWDLTVGQLAKVMREEYGKGEELVEAECLNELSSGGPSGGTIETMFLALGGDESMKCPQYGMNPLLRRADGSESTFLTKPKLPIAIGRRGAEGLGAEEDRFASRWTSPFVMAGVNSEVVRRSNALLEMGTSLTYRESVVAPDFKTAFVDWATLGIFFTALLNPVTATLLRTYVLPRPGQGPSREAMEGAYLCVTGRGKGSRGSVVESAMYFPVDAGYMDTARMLAESGLCLAFDRDDLPERGRGGFFSSASGMGDALLRRLCRTGTVFSSRAVSSGK